MGRIALIEDRGIKKKKSAYRRGLWAEYIASFWLICKGYHILGRRLRTPLAEIDLLVRHRFFNRDVLVIVEVKFRQDATMAYSALQPKQLQRLHHAGLWLQSIGYLKYGDSLRWDYIAISPKKGVCHIQQIEL